MKFDYGETYGNGSAKYFQDHRIHTQGTSRENTAAGGYFASPYSSTPSLAVESRTRTWDRWAQAPNYRLTYQDHDRREELINFTQVSTYYFSV